MEMEWRIGGKCAYPVHNSYIALGINVQSLEKVGGIACLQSWLGNIHDAALFISCSLHGLKNEKKGKS